MLKNHHNDFPSDVFNIMTVLKASLYTGMCNNVVLHDIETKYNTWTTKSTIL